MATTIPRNRAAFSAAEVAVATMGTLASGAPETRVTSVSTDSRHVAAGDLFVALRGDQHDGHRYLSVVIEAGAAAVVVERGSLDLVPPGSNVAVVAVDDTLVALGRLARAHRHRWARGQRARGGQGVVVAVTGSAGKTTTKELCAAALRGALGREAVLVTRGNLNNLVGAPMTLLSLHEGHRAAVIEVGTSQRGEIAALAAIVAPEVSLLVSVGVAHAEGLAVDRESPREAVAREKGALHAAASVAAVSCADDPWAVASLHRAAASTMTLTFGRDEEASCKLEGLSSRAKGSRVVSRVTLNRQGRSALVVDLPLLGEVAALDLAGAVAAADAALRYAGHPEVTAPGLAAELSLLRPVPGRLAPRVRADGAVVLDDSYNANPASFAASLETARTLAKETKRRLVVVAGEMRELGKYAEALHDEVGANVVAAGPALLFTCGGLAERIADVAARDGVVVRRFASAADARGPVAEAIGPTDLVLVKGSRGVTTELVVEAILARGGEIEDAPGEGGD